LLVDAISRFALVTHTR